MMFQVPSIIQSIRTLVDGGCKLDIVTRELSPDEMTMLFGLKNKEGWLLFKDNPIVESEVANIPDEPMDEFDKKSPSQRLRDRMFVFYKKTHKDTKEFKTWYANTLDAIGNQYLDKMN